MAFEVIIWWMQMILFFMSLGTCSHRLCIFNHDTKQDKRCGFEIHFALGRENTMQKISKSKWNQRLTHFPIRDLYYVTPQSSRCGGLHYNYYISLGFIYTALKYQHYFQMMLLIKTLFAEFFKMLPKIFLKSLSLVSI